MTRFARSKGSKASNERVPEEATSWTTMKEQMEQKEKETLEKTKRKEFEEKRKANYKAFLEEKEQDVTPKWTQFESADNNANIKVAKKKGKKRKSIETEEDIENDIQLRGIIGEIEKVLEKDESGTSDKIKGKNKKKIKLTNEVANENNVETDLPPPKNKIKRKRKGKSDTVENDMNGELCNENNADDDNDAPAEVSAKVAPKSIKNKKAKSLKKGPLKIPSVETPKVNDEEQTDNQEVKEMDVKAWRAEKKRIKKLKIQQNKKQADQEKPKKSVDEMTEDELKRYNKKKEKRLRQLQNKKKRKEAEKEKNSPMEQNMNKNVNKNKIAKIRDNNKEHARRKPESHVQTMFINGVDVKIDYIDGFPVKKEDADRLRKLRKEMISKGIPRSEVQVALKLERRKAEKALAREKKNVCFNCRKSGHVLSECPNLNENSQQEMTGTGICFKCGSTEHTHFECKVIKTDNYNYATCFICKQQGHISRQCPDNQKGLYPKGGACKVCGDVTHLKKDCPKFQVEQESRTIKLDTMDDSNLEALPEEKKNKQKRDSGKHNKIVKF